MNNQAVFTQLKALYQNHLTVGSK